LILGWDMTRTCFHEFLLFRAFSVSMKMKRCNLFFPPALPCSYFLFICLICLKQQTVRTKISKFLRGSFWVCTDVFPHKTPVFIIYRFLFPSSTTVISSQNTHLILSLIHNCLLTLMFHSHVPETHM